MAYKPTGRPRGRPPKAPPDTEGFGFAPTDREPAPAAAAPIPTPQEILDLGLPPEDASGIEKYNYRMLSTLAALALRDTNLSFDKRMALYIKATTAAARHFPTAVKHDLAEKIRADAAALEGRKKAKAAAQLETRPAAGAAKIIPIRPVEQADGEVG